MGKWNFFDRPEQRAWISWLPEWAVKKQDQRFLEALLDCKGDDDVVLHRHINRTLFTARWKRAIEPYTRIFRLAREVFRGRYWTTAAQVHGGANQAPGGSGPARTVYAGAQFTGYGGGFSAAGKSAPATAAFEDAGIRAGEITGYRCWRLFKGKLYSMYQEAFCWEPGTVVEGDAAAGNGIHAFKDMLAVGAYGYDPHASVPVVSGTVELWGEVYVHERGYRASKAAIASIDDSPNYDAKALRKTYGLTKRKRPKKKA